MKGGSGGGEGMKGGSGMRGGMAAGRRPVSEANRIDIAAKLEHFRASSEQELLFESDLSNHDRAVVHTLCRKMGLMSRSHGKGSDRKVTVSKKKAINASGGEKGEDVPVLQLRPESQAAIVDLLLQFPPTELEMTSAMGEGLVGSSSSRGDGRGGGGGMDEEGWQVGMGEERSRSTGGEVHRGGVGGGVEERGVKKGGKLQQQQQQPITKQQAESRAKALAAKMQQMPALREMNEKRKQLPIASFRDKIVEAVRRHQVIIIAGETGCGKTTQVPQFLLESEWAEGRSPRIVCSQPRRMSASSVAERIAAERGEAVGETVGYQIRLESQGGPHCSLWLCTNGVLLRQIVTRGHGSRTKGDGMKTKDGDSSSLGGLTSFPYSHIIIDEIHERDRFADFMLIILRDLLPYNPNLRVVLMSATINIDLFSKYFANCPVLQVPGFTHPVQSLFLEDALQLVSGVKHRGKGGGRGKGRSEQGGEEVLGEEIEEGDVLEAKEGEEGEDGEYEEELQEAEEGGKVEEWDGIDAMNEAIERAWLEDDFSNLMAMVAGGGPENKRLVNIQHSETGATALMVAAGKGRVEEAELLLLSGASLQIKSSDGSNALQWAERFNQTEMAAFLAAEEQKAAERRKQRSSRGQGHEGSEGEREEQQQRIEGETEAAEGESGEEGRGTEKEGSNETAELLHRYQSSIDQEEVDLNLIQKLLHFICSQQNDLVSTHNSPDNAILIFLPGWEDISRLRDNLEASPQFSDEKKFWVLPLHSMLPSIDQRKVFSRPPLGVRKIVLATNIAETSITIDDVVYVIDSGRMKEKSFDPYSNVSTLQMIWVSKAAAKQREGRAGRCRPGLCFHLFSRKRAASLPDFQLPEMKRMPLEELCLQIKVLDASLDISSFLSRALEPPVPVAVSHAISLLQDIGALDAKQQLTPLGKHLGMLPLHPVTSKMILHGILLDCLGPALTLAATSAQRDPFVLPTHPGQRKSYLAAREELANVYGGGSDHLLLVAAFDLWEAARSCGQKEENAFCARYFVARGTMAMIAGMRNQLKGELQRKGLVPPGHDPCNWNAKNAGIIRAVIAAGLYPLVGSLLPPIGMKQRSASTILTARGEKVRIHPHSMNFQLQQRAMQAAAAGWGGATEALSGKPGANGGGDEGGGGGWMRTNEAAGCPLLVFDEVTRGESLVTVRSSSVVNPHPLILISAEMVVAPIQEDEEEEGGGGRGTVNEPDGRRGGLEGDVEDDDGEGSELEEEEEEEEGVLIVDPNSRKERLRRRQADLMAEPDRRILIVVDRWLRFKATAVEAAQLFCLRERLAAAFAYKVCHPRDSLPPVYAASLYAIACIFSFEEASLSWLYSVVPSASLPSSTSAASASASNRSADFAATMLPNPSGRVESGFSLPRHGGQVLREDARGRHGNGGSGGSGRRGGRGGRGFHIGRHKGTFIGSGRGRGKETSGH